MKKSVQIFADFKQCQVFLKYLIDAEFLKLEVKKIIKKSGFKVVDFCIHKFEKNGGISLVFLVSESHVAIHTWPEHNSLNLDIFFCNYNKNNKQKAIKAFKMFHSLFKPKTMVKRTIRRTY